MALSGSHYVDSCGEADVLDGRPKCWACMPASPERNILALRNQPHGVVGSRFLSLPGFNGIIGRSCEDGKITLVTGRRVPEVMLQKSAQKAAFAACGLDLVGVFH